jgi:hypothetical protein
MLARLRLIQLTAAMPAETENDMLSKSKANRMRLTEAIVWTFPLPTVNPLFGTKKTIGLSESTGTYRTTYELNGKRSPAGIDRASWSFRPRGHSAQNMFADDRAPKTWAQSTLSHAENTFRHESHRYHRSALT